MSAPVPSKRTIVPWSEIVAGAAVSSRVLTPCNDLLAWCMGRGAQLIPHFRPREVTIVANDTHTYRFVCQQRFSSMRRVWVVIARCATGGTDVSLGEITAGAMAPREFAAFSDINNHNAVVIEENGVAQSSDEQELTLTIAATIGDIIVESIACYEAPRAILTPGTNDLSLHRESLMSGVPLYDDALEESSIAVLAQGVNGVWDSTRRVGMMQWACDATTTNALPLTSTTYADVFSLPQKMLGRRKYLDDTVCTLGVRVLVRTSATGISGTFRFTTSNSGSTETIAIPTAAHTAFTWYPLTSTDPMFLAVDAEDQDGVSGGLRGGTDDELTIECDLDSAGTIYLAGISITERKA